MKNALIIACGLIISLNAANAQLSDIFKFKNEIGKPKNLGSYVYNPIDQSYLLRGSGYNIWFERDEFHFMYNRFRGNFMITANFRLERKGAKTHRKTGLMLRATEDADSPHISAVSHGDGLTVMQWRDFKGAPMKDPEDDVFASNSKYEVIQIERSGKIIYMRGARNNEPMEDIGSYEMENLPDEILAGPFICSHDPEVIEEATIWNIRIDRPVSDNYDPGKEGYH